MNFKELVAGNGTDTTLAQSQGTGVDHVHALPDSNSHVNIPRRRASRDKKRKAQDTDPVLLVLSCAVSDPLWLDLS